MSLSIPEIFSKYKNAVIDASFFDCGIRADVWEELKKLKVWLPKTFSSECQSFEKLIKDNLKRDIYRQQLERINKELTVRELDASREELSEAVGFKLHSDTFGIVKFISSQFPKQAVILTANEILMEQIILNNEAIDIFDLNTNSLLSCEGFEPLKSKYEVLSSTEPIALEQKIKEGTVLTTGKHTVTLGNVFNSGGAEGKLYHVYGPDNVEYKNRIAKIFLPQKRTSGKLKNIVNMKSLSDRGVCDWATFPSEVLYLPETMDPVGYIMPFIENPNVLGDSVQYAGDLSDPDCNLDQKISETLDLCIKITRQTIFLNKYGTLVFDFNTDNFVYPTAPEGNMIIWDTDSLGYKNYISNASAPNSSVSRTYDLQQKYECIQYSYDKLYQGIFNLLTLGDNPLDEDTHEYLYSNTEYHSYYRRAFIPENVIQLFDDTFMRGYPFSPEVLLSELVSASLALKSETWRDKTYAELCDIEPEPSIPPMPPTSSVKDKNTGLWIAIAGAVLVLFIIIIAILASQNFTSEFLPDNGTAEVLLNEMEIDYEYC